MNYQSFRLSKKEWLKSTLWYLAGDVAAGILFYNSWKAIAVFFIFFPVYILGVKKYFREKRMHQLKLDFRELMTILYSSISTGTSLENALMQADQELSCCCSAKSDILIELQEMKNKMKMNTSVLACLRDFASRCCDDDVINFYEAVSIAKQYSGGMGSIIRNAMTQMNEKIELKCEMETLIASKRQEFLIMAAVPLGIMAYMRLNSPELMCVLYETMIGRITMTIVLVVYIIAVIWGIKLIRIKV